MTRIDPLQRFHLDAAKRVIATVVIEYYFEGRYTTEELLVSYEKSGYLTDLDQMEDVYGGRNGLLLGVFDGEAVVGTGGVKQTEVDSGELGRLWLLKDFRGRGIGRQLIERLLEFARESGWKRLRLDTSVRCKEAVALFRKVGFHEVAPFKESIGDCFMELDLSKSPKRRGRLSASKVRASALNLPN